MLGARWEALRGELLGPAISARRKVSELGRESQYLAIIAAWFEAGGNITHAAERLGTGRRAVRERVKEWLREHPHLVPYPIARPLKQPEVPKRSEPRRRRRKAQAGRPEAEASLP
jgi:hypothetical protein